MTSLDAFKRARELFGLAAETQGAATEIALPDGTRVGRYRIGYVEGRTFHVVGHGDSWDAAVATAEGRCSRG